LLSGNTRIYPQELTQIARKARTTLCESSKRFGGDGNVSSQAGYPATDDVVLNTDDTLMLEQLRFISKLSVDIDKTTRALNG
jgi:hypothetical protein